MLNKISGKYLNDYKSRLKSFTWLESCEIFDKCAKFKWLPHH